MKRLSLLGAALVGGAISLAACGGGGSSAGSVTPPIRSAANSVAFQATYLGASLANAMRRPRSTSGCASTSSGDVAVENLANYKPLPGQSVAYLNGWNVAAQEIGPAPGCSVISTSPTYSTDNANVVALNPTGVGLPTPAPGSANVGAAGHGLANVIATFSDGTTGTIAVHAYDPLVIGCGGAPYTNEINAWSVTSGQVFTTAAADVYAIGGYCSPPFQGPQPPSIMLESGLVFPYGYQFTPAAPGSFPFLTLAGITNASAFTSQGTVFGYLSSTTSIPASAPSPPNGVLVFKTAAGAYVKTAIIGSDCSGSWVVFQGATGPAYNSCDEGGSVTMIYAVSDQNGSFAY